MVTYLGGSILITIFALGGSIVSYNLQRPINLSCILYSTLPIAAIDVIIFLIKDRSISNIGLAS
jgi:hypothetical protein